MNGIILAAGLGKRLAPLTDAVPKPLVKIKGVPIIERQITCLREVGVDLITIIVGYLAKKFAYLTDKYRNIEIVQNELYAKDTNFYSMYLARHRFIGETYVLEGDVYLRRNFLKKKVDRSCYFIGYRRENQNEWSPEIDKSGKVHSIKIVSSPAFILTGVSYWVRDDARIIVKLIEDNQNALIDWLTRYWDDIPRLNLDKLKITTRKVDEADWAEIDTLQDYDRLKQSL